MEATRHDVATRGITVVASGVAHEATTTAGEGAFVAVVHSRPHFAHASRAKPVREVA